MKHALFSQPGLKPLPLETRGVGKKDGDRVIDIDPPIMSAKLNKQALFFNLFKTVTVLCTSDVYGGCRGCSTTARASLALYLPPDSHSAGDLQVLRTDTVLRK